VAGGERWRERGGGRKCNQAGREWDVVAVPRPIETYTTVGDQRTLHTVSMCIMCI
jgi:hypothetical protein